VTCAGVGAGMGAFSGARKQKAALISIVPAPLPTECAQRWHFPAFAHPRPQGDSVCGVASGAANTRVRAVPIDRVKDAQRLDHELWPDRQQGRTGPIERRLWSRMSSQLKHG
jgi:hypothetical protein